MKSLFVIFIIVSFIYSCCGDSKEESEVWWATGDAVSGETIVHGDMSNSLVFDTEYGEYISTSDKIEVTKIDSLFWNEVYLKVDFFETDYIVAFNKSGEPIDTIVIDYLETEE